jgi:CelD/BcsL family acetyltransferase involved in cellulose biosynthesis
MGLLVTLEALPSRAQLKDWWRTLESRADTGFFTTWSWIEPWLDLLPPALSPRLLVAREGTQVVGLGLLTEGRATVLKRVPVRCWHLHTTGDPDLDSVAIEYNDFLVAREHGAAIRQAMLAHLMAMRGPARLDIAKAGPDFLALTPPLRDRLIVRTTEITSYVVPLDDVRAAKAGYLSLLSANTRSQVKRSMSAYQQLGPLAIDDATDLTQALDFFHAMRALHAHNWGQKGEETAFASLPAVERFHDALITQAWPRGEVRLMRIRAGDTVLGYLYGFVFRGHLLYYQSGFQFGLVDKHDRPGLVCHALAVEHCAQQGLAHYDFGAGDYRYKTSLSTAQFMQYTHVLQRKNLLAHADTWLRTAQQAWRKRRAAAAEAASSATSVVPVVLVASVLSQLSGDLPW